MNSSRSILPQAFVLVCLWTVVAFPQDPTEPGVSMLLSNVTINGVPPKLLFRCKVTLDNATGREFTVRSNFNSVFDGLELVITNTAGTVLVQQRYLYHQSPRSSKPTEFVLNKGKTSRDLVFPVSIAGFSERSVKVRLVGTLPGSSYQRILSTDTLTVELLDGALGAERRILRGDRDPELKPASFAIAGFFDFNKNGKSDVDTMRELIKASGGAINAEIDREGNIKGELTATTRYLILAEVPTKENSTPEKLQKYSDFMKQVEELNIEILHAKGLLGMRTRRPKVDDETAAKFRPRRPPKRDSGGAYCPAPSKP